MYHVNVTQTVPDISPLMPMHQDPLLVSSFGHYLILTHWGRGTHTCVGILTSIGSDNGLSPGRRQAIVWTNAGILLIEPLGTNFSEFRIQNSSIFIQENAFENVVCEMASILSRPQCVNISRLRSRFQLYLFFFCLLEIPCVIAAMVFLIVIRLSEWFSMLYRDKLINVLSIKQQQQQQTPTLNQNQHRPTTTTATTTTSTKQQPQQPLPKQKPRQP